MLNKKMRLENFIKNPSNFLIKFFEKEEYMLEFKEKGSIFMHMLKYYRNIEEDNGIGDEEEGSYYDKKAKLFYMEDEKYAEAFPYEFRVQCSGMFPIYCMSRLCGNFSTKNFFDYFYKKYNKNELYFAIVSIREFVEKFHSYFNKKYNCRIDSKQVVYSDEWKYSIMDYLEASFHKRNKYSWQYEYRFVISKKFETTDNSSKLEDIFIKEEIGTLSDICCCCKIGINNENVIR
ncbi:MAG: hypothetical protein OSJ67_06220 [Clostridia bacterium]|nr:hypothetical protein [Clostridia bacterium]